MRDCVVDFVLLVAGWLLPCRGVDLASQRALIEKGYVFIACPPLFKIKQGKTEKYVYTQVCSGGRTYPAGPLHVVFQ